MYVTLIYGQINIYFEEAKNDRKWILGTQDDTMTSSTTCTKNHNNEKENRMTFSWSIPMMISFLKK